MIILRFLCTFRAFFLRTINVTKFHAMHAEFEDFTKINEHVSNKVAKQRYKTM